MLRLKQLEIMATKSIHRRPTHRPLNINPYSDTTAVKGKIVFEEESDLQREDLQGSYIYLDYAYKALQKKYLWDVNARVREQAGWA